MKLSKPLAPSTTIGIVGAGQLGKMIACSAQKMGYKVATYDPNPTSCAFAVSNWYKVATFNDREALLEFARSVDVLTYEFENIDGPLIEEIAQDTDCFLPQGSKLLLLSQNRLTEKNWLSSIGLPVVNYEAVLSQDDLKKALTTIGLPAILKTTRLGYDGKGQIRITDSTDVTEKKEEINRLLESPCVLEAKCSFELECSVMVSRDQSGTIELFPISENVHRSGILHSSLVPARISQVIRDDIHLMARKIAEEGQLVGVLGIEFFIEKTPSGEKVFINELAPRPHNSGHYSIEACNFSQFDQHVVAITGRPLASIKLLSPVLMVNLLGQDMPLVKDIWQNEKNAVVHLYQKGEAKVGRKMGHVTFLDSTVEKVIKKADLW